MKEGFLLCSFFIGGIGVITREKFKEKRAEKLFIFHL